MKALYRKYRPKTLSEVVGQEQVTKILASSLAAGKINHAYLFIGPRGTGKTSVARIFAHEVNGFQYELEDDYVDIVEIDGASNRGIDNIRELKEKAMVAPTSGKYKVYIIDEVHMLTKEAFNALLKTLEEPPAHVIFIMATTDAYKVPVTITSRAQTYTFRLAEKAVMTDFLKSVAKQEKIKIADDALDIIVKRGGGSFRDSLSLLDQIATLSDEKITKTMVIEAMGLPEDDKIRHLLDQYMDGNLPAITKTMRDLLATGVKPETVAEEMLQNILDEPRPELMPLLSRLPEVREPFAEARLLVCLAEHSLAQATTTSQRPAVATTGLTTTSQRPVVTMTATRLETRSITESIPVDTKENTHDPIPTQATTETAIRQETTENYISQENTHDPIPAQAITETTVRQETTENYISQENVSDAAMGPSKPSDSGATTSQTESTPELGQKTTNATQRGQVGIFDWNNYLERIRALNEVIYVQLKKSEYEVLGQTLHIYPKTKIIRNILTSKNNKHILLDNSNGLLVEVHEAGEHPSSAVKDELLSKFSAIMGGEVTNEDGGSNPF